MYTCHDIHVLPIIPYLIHVVHAQHVHVAHMYTNFIHLFVSHPIQKLYAITDTANQEKPRLLETFKT